MCNLRLVTDGVNRDDATLEHQNLKQVLDRGNLVAFALRPFLGQTQATPAQVGADHVQGRIVTVARATQGLAVKRHHPVNDTDQTGDPVPKALFEDGGVQQPKDASEGVMRRRPSLGRNILP